MDDLKAKVRQLSPAQLGELRTYINGLMMVGGAREAPAAEGLLLAVFEDSCRRLGLGFVQPPVKQLVRKREAALKTFLEGACPDSSAVVHRTILATGIDLLYKDLQENGRIINPRNLAYGLDRLPAVLDRSFPGYAACGHLARVVRKAA